MESQPLACAKQADANTQAQCMAPDGVTVNANASTSYCTEATDGGHGVQAGPEPSSPAVAHQLAEIQHTAADDSTQLQESPVLHSDRAEGQCVASGAWPNRGFGSEAVCVDDVGEVADTQEGSLAAVQPNDDEAEVCHGLIAQPDQLACYAGCMSVSVGLPRPFKIAKLCTSSWKP